MSHFDLDKIGTVGHSVFLGEGEGVGVTSGRGPDKQRLNLRLHVRNSETVLRPRTAGRVAFASKETVAPEIEIRSGQRLRPVLRRIKGSTVADGLSLV